jgi:hypothetical protein
LTKRGDIVTKQIACGFCGVVLAMFPTLVSAQQSQPPAPVQQQTTPAAQSAAKPAPSPQNDGKVRVYISDSQSWEIVGGWGMAGHRNADGSGDIGGGGYTAGGARPQTAEIIKTFNKRCPELTVTGNRDKANYAVILDHEGGKGLLRHRNKIAVFNRDSDVIFSDSTRELGNSVKDACAAILKDAGQAGATTPPAPK